MGLLCIKDAVILSVKVVIILKPKYWGTHNIVE
jgi:hypothetical protein